MTLPLHYSLEKRLHQSKTRTIFRLLNENIWLIKNEIIQTDTIGEEGRF